MQLSLMRVSLRVPLWLSADASIAFVFQQSLRRGSLPAPRSRKCLSRMRCPRSAVGLQPCLIAHHPELRRIRRCFGFLPCLARNLSLGRCGCPRWPGDLALSADLWFISGAAYFLLTFFNWFFFFARFYAFLRLLYSPLRSGRKAPPRLPSSLSVLLFSFFSAADVAAVSLASTEKVKEEKVRVACSLVVESNRRRQHHNK
jgi:hypothetical protein